MRRPPLRYVIVVASVFALVGLIWGLTIGKRGPIAARQRAAQNLPLQADLHQQLQEYRKRINDLTRKEFWALVEAENETEALAKSRRKAEHVGRYGVPAHVEYYTQMIARSSKAAAASQERAAFSVGKNGSWTCLLPALGDRAARSLEFFATFLVLAVTADLYPNYGPHALRVSRRAAFALGKTKRAAGPSENRAKVLRVALRGADSKSIQAAVDAAEPGV